MEGTKWSSAIRASLYLRTRVLLNMIKQSCVSVLTGSECFPTHWGIVVLDSHSPFFTLYIHFLYFVTWQYLLLEWVKQISLTHWYYLGYNTFFNQWDVSGCNVSRSLICAYMVSLAHICSWGLSQEEHGPVTAGPRRMRKHLECSWMQPRTWC